MIYDNFSIFITNCAFACGTRACILRGFLRMPGAGKWCPKFQKSFMLLVNTPTRLCLLEIFLNALFFYEVFGTYRNKYCLMKKVNDFAFKFATFFTAKRYRSRWENLNRGQCRFQPIKFVNLVPRPCETEPEVNMAGVVCFRVYEPRQSHSHTCMHSNSSQNFTSNLNFLCWDLFRSADIFGKQISLTCNHFV